jgi:uncharacterized protein (TIGR03435 family)
LTGFKVVVVALNIPLTTPLVAQVSASGSRPQFDVASIRVDNDPISPRIKRIQGGPGTDDPGRITYRQMPLIALIDQAYDVAGDQLAGRTENLANNKFTITATFPVGTTKERFRMMLQDLLTERFHLVLHHETRNFPGYELIVAQGGPKFHSWSADPNIDPAVPAQSLQPGQAGFRWTTKLKPPLIHVTNRQSMADFASTLPMLQLYADNTRGDTDRDEALRAAALGGSVLPLVLPRFIDKTGLTGMFEFSLDFEGAMIPRASEGGITLSEALEKQLGLRLVKVKSVPVDVLVIDRIDKTPTEN